MMLSEVQKIQLLLPRALIIKCSQIALQVTSGMEMGKDCSYFKNNKCCFSIGLSCLTVCNRGFAAVC